MSETFESISFRDESGLPSDWREGAACKGVSPNMFFPSRGENKTVAMAIDICKRCVIIDDCLHYALSNYIKVGIYGGKSERQRRALRREIQK